MPFILADSERSSHKNGKNSFILIETRGHIPTISEIRIRECAGNDRILLLHPGRYIFHRPGDRGERPCRAQSRTSGIQPDERHRTDDRHGRGGAVFSVRSAAKGQGPSDSLHTCPVPVRARGSHFLIRRSADPGADRAPSGRRRGYHRVRDRLSPHPPGILPTLSGEQPAHLLRAK